MPETIRVRRSLRVLAVTMLVAGMLAPALGAIPDPHAAVAAAAVSCPPVQSDGYRHVGPSDAKNLPAIVAGCPANSKFKLAGGAYYMKDTIVPQSGDVFVGNGASGSNPTVLYGSRKISCTTSGSNTCSNWKKNSSKQWQFTITKTANSAIAKICTSAGNSPACNQTGYAGMDDIYDSSGYGMSCVHPSGYPQAAAGTERPGICDYFDTLYVGGSFFPRVLSPDPTHPCSSSTGLKPGTPAYCINYHASSNGGYPTIYLGVNPSTLSHISYSGVLDSHDPTGRGILQVAFTANGPSGPAANVTISKLKITQYGDSVGPKGVVRTGDGWVVGDPSLLPAGNYGSVVISYAHTCGISLSGIPTTVAEVTTSHNGQNGICGNQQGDGSIVIENSIDHTNVHRSATHNGTTQTGTLDEFNSGRAAAGLRVSSIDGLDVVGNHVAGNIGKGLWFDDGSTNVTVAGNSVTDQARDVDGPPQGGDGIQVEISCGSPGSPIQIGGPDLVTVAGSTYTFHGNTVSGNADNGIWILNSSGVTVGPSSPGADANTVGTAGHFNGTEIRIAATGRAYSCHSTASTDNNLVRNNVVAVGPQDSVLVYAQILEGVAHLSNNQFVGNRFTLSTPNRSGSEIVGFDYGANCAGCTITVSANDFSANTYSGGQCGQAIWSMPLVTVTPEPFASWHAGAGGAPVQDAQGSCA